MTTDPVRIDASALDGFNLLTYFADYFAGFDSGDNEFFGGFPTQAFGGAPFFVSGSQVLTTYRLPPEAAGDDAEPVPTNTVALLEGDGIAYDFLVHGPQFGHGITGKVNSLKTGTFVEGQSSKAMGTGPEGAVTGLDTGLVIDGLGLESEPGAGPVPTNPVNAIYSALQDMDSDAIVALLKTYSLEIIGTGSTDSIRGFDGDDMLMAKAGDDVAFGGRGDDEIRGGAGGDEVRGGRGADDLDGGADADMLVGSIGNDSIDGGDGADTITGGLGKDVLTGGDGPDVFVIRGTSKRDIITDFVSGTDKIDVTELAVSGLDDFTIVEGNGSVRLQLGDVRVRLEDVAEADLDAGDFLF